MKKTLLFSLVLITLSGFAQDWAPFKITDSVRHFSSRLYQQQSPQNDQLQSTVLKSFSQDSNTNTTTLVFKKGFTRVFNTYTPKIIKSQIFGDTLVVNSDSSVFKTIDSNGFELTFPHALYFGKTFTLGVNSVNQYLVATVDSMYTDSINNTLDSVARMNIVFSDSLGVTQTSSAYHNKKIILSKSNGMIKGIDFTNLDVVAEVEQYFSSKTRFTNDNHYSLTIGDEYHYRDNALMNSFGDYYETIIKIIGDSNHGANRTLTFEQRRKKSFPSQNPGNVQTSNYSKTFMKSEEMVEFQSQIIEESEINQTPLYSSVVPKVNLFYLCDNCGFFPLGLIQDTTFFSLEYSSFTNKRDSILNNRGGLYIGDEFLMLGLGDGGYYSYNNGNTSHKEIVYIKKGNQTWGHPLNLYVGIDEVVKKNELLLYPNPAQTQLNISNSLKIEQAIILDLQGKEVRNFGNQNTIDISELKPGIYFLQMKTRNEIRVQKFVKE